MLIPLFERREVVGKSLGWWWIGRDGLRTARQNNKSGTGVVNVDGHSCRWGTWRELRRWKKKWVLVPVVSKTIGRFGHIKLGARAVNEKFPMSM